MVFLDDKKFQLFAASAAVVDDVYSRVSHITYKMFISLNTGILPMESSEKSVTYLVDNKFKNKLCKKLIFQNASMMISHCLN